VNCSKFRDVYFLVSLPIFKDLPSTKYLLVFFSCLPGKINNFFGEKYQKRNFSLSPPPQIFFLEARGVLKILHTPLSIAILKVSSKFLEPLFETQKLPKYLLFD